MWILGLLLALFACFMAWRTPAAAKLPWTLGAVGLALLMAAWTFFGGSESRPPAPPGHLVDQFFEGGRVLGETIAASVPGGGPIIVLGKPSALPPTYRQLHDRQMEGLRRALPAARFPLVPFDLARDSGISALVGRGETIGAAEIALFDARSPDAAAVVVLDYGLESGDAATRQGPPVYVISIGEPGNLQALVDRGQARAGVVIPVGPDRPGASPEVIR